MDINLDNESTEALKALYDFTKERRMWLKAQIDKGEHVPDNPQYTLYLKTERILHNELMTRVASFQSKYDIA